MNRQTVEYAGQTPDEGLGPWDLVQIFLAMVVSSMALGFAERWIGPPRAPCVLSALYGIPLAGGLLWGMVRLGRAGRCRLARQAFRINARTAAVWGLAARIWFTILGLQVLYVFVATWVFPALPASQPASPSTPIFWLIVGAPLAEEVLFRGVLLGGLSRRFGAIPGLLASSTLFGLAHPGILGFLGAFTFGLGEGLLFLRTRSLVPCIGVHVVNNAVAAGLGGLDAVAGFLTKS